MKFLPFLILVILAKLAMAASPEPTPSIFKNSLQPTLGQAPRITVTAGVKSARGVKQLALKHSDAFSLSQLEEAKAKATAEHKPLGFIMVWDTFFGSRETSRGTGSGPGLVHFYQAFNKSLVLVFVRHESELGSVPAAVKKGFSGPDEGGFAPNMAVTDAAASEFIVEIPYGGNASSGPIRDAIFATAATKIDDWLKTHPLAVADSTAVTQ